MNWWALPLIIITVALIGAALVNVAATINASVIVRRERRRPLSDGPFSSPPPWHRGRR